MARLTIYRDHYADSTVVSNLFIDEYMKEANDAQLKVYFYLIRMLNADQHISVSEIADKFNYTEKDILRALKYWEKLQILCLDYDEDKSITGIRMRDLCALGTAPVRMEAPVVSNPETPVLHTAMPEIPAKPSYSPDQLKEFKNRQETAQLLFIAESYLGRPLTPQELKAVLFFTDVLHFSEDLIDYLLQYCVDRGKRDFKYIEKVAVNWAEAGITTPTQARDYASKYDRGVYTIMNGLGRSSSPTPKEMEFINRWTKEYGFADDIILEACERASLATDKHRFEYAEQILSSWRSKNVRHKADIHRIDDLYRKKKTAGNSSTPGKFHQFTQNNYDFDALERELLSN